MLKIVLTGPESTGKTTLAKQLADHFKTEWVAEYARHFIDKLNRPYVEADLLEIAERQLEWEKHLERFAREVLIYDTDLLTIKVWSEFRFGRCHPQILSWIKQRHYDHYLLCGTDVVWHPDPQRENPNDRDLLFDIYKKELALYKKDFTEIRGNEQQRLQQSIAIISSFL